MNAETDQRLSDWMQRAQDGDREAYARLLGEVAAQLRRFLGSRVQQAAAVDDIVQEVLLSIHRDRHTYDPGRPFAAWMYAIARHRLVDWTRRRRRVEEREELAEAAYEPATGTDPVTERTLSERFAQAFGRLTGAQREVIQLLQLDGWSVKQIARHTGKSESAVKVSAHRGYLVLRKLLASGADDD